MNNNFVFGFIMTIIIGGFGGFLWVFNPTVSAPFADSRGSGPVAYDAGGKWYKLMCIDGVQYISSYRRLTVKMLDTGLPATCDNDDVSFNQDNWYKN